jgi:hypothetical protein
MSAPRQTYHQLQRTVAELTREKEISDRLRLVAEREIAALRAALQPAPAPRFVPIKLAD